MYIIHFGWSKTPLSPGAMCLYGPFWSPSSRPHRTLTCKVNRRRVSPTLVGHLQTAKVGKEKHNGLLCRMCPSARVALIAAHICPGSRTRGEVVAGYTSQ